MIIPRYFGFTEFTPEIPQLYWNVYSNEQRIKAICKELGKVIQYADMLGINVDEIKQTLTDIEDGKLDTIIVEAIEQWFEENQPEIMNELDLLTDLIANTRNELQDQIGDGFSAQHSVEDALQDEAENREQDINDLKTYFDENIKDIAWNCEFRSIVDTWYDTAVSKSMQGFCMYEINDVKYVAQAFMFEDEEGIIIYRYDTNTEVTRITGNYGHLNDLTFNDNILYALNESTRTLNRFSVNSNSIVFIGSSVIPVNAVAIEIKSEGIYTAYSQGENLGINVVHYSNDSFTTTLETFNIPFDGRAVIQGISVNGNDIFIALTDPNTLIYIMADTGNYYFVNVPQYIGHCFVDEIEGVYIDNDKNLYFNTNSSVDMLLIASVFNTNLIHSSQKEVDTSLQMNRFGNITAIIDYENGSLTNPAGFSNKFKLVGDAINYVRSIGANNLILQFTTDYPHPIIANSVNIQIQVPGSNAIALNGIIGFNSNILFPNVTKVKLNPIEENLLLYDGVYYGAYLSKCQLNIPLGTFPTPDIGYDATHKRVYCANTIALIQEVSHYRFYNCLVTKGAAAVSSTTIYERTVFLEHYGV